MSTNTISASNLPTPAAVYAPALGTRRLDGGDRDSSGDNSQQGITLLASLLQALTQAASAQPATAATPAAGASGTTPAATSSSAASTASTSDTNSTGTASGTSLVQDLQAFLHDLFGALRHAGRSHHGGREHASDDDRTAAASAPATAATAATTPTPAPGAAATSSPTPAPGATAYGHHGIVSELNVLIQDLSQTAGNPGSSSGLSSERLSNLNSAFEKLIGDLGGGAPSAGSSAPSGSAAASGQSTSALQAFLINFLQDLQANGAHSLNSVGSSINTTA